MGLMHRGNFVATSICLWPLFLLLQLVVSGTGNDASYNAAAPAAMTPQLPPRFSAVYLFGDSTVDTGNNNYIPTIARANFHPYGINYPGHVPTGRFSDGQLVPDLIASALGIKDSIPPFLDPTLSDDELLTGVCFASAGAGFGDVLKYLVITGSEQLKMFRDYKKKLESIVGEERACQVIGNALVIISAGTNDLRWRIKFNETSYHDVLLGMLRDFVKELYDMGCRSMLISDLPPLGCLPDMMTESENPFDRKCIASYNLYLESYNKKLSKLLPEIEATLPGTRIVYLGLYDLVMDMVNQPKKYGFVETKRGCCGTGTFELAVACNPITPICANVSAFLFWDAAHPTLAANKLFADFVVKQVIPKFL